MQHPRVRRLVPWAVLVVASWAVAFALILPVRTGQVGFDSAASVLYFDRIVSGLRLEAFVTATPKPLLTFLYGPVHALTGDWRPISWLAIGAFGVAVALAAELARRLAGPAAAGFAALGFMGSAVLLQDVGLAYAMVWALLGWLIAGLALTGDRPRYGIAGIALLLASLARIETLIVVGVATVVLVAMELAPRVTRWRPGPVPRESWLILLGFAAIPIQLLHDYLLTGDPFWSESVPVAGSVGAPIIGPFGALRFIVLRYLSAGPFVALAVIGVVLLWHRRRWPILIGLLAIGPGVLAFNVFLGVRGIYISTRYFTPADLALLFTASVGIGAVQVPLLALLARARLRPPLSAASVVLAGALAGFLFAAPFAFLSTSVRATIRGNLAFHANADRALPTIRTAIDEVPGVRLRPPTPDAHAGVTSGRPAVLLVPALLRPQMAVDLGLPLDRIAGTAGPRLATDGSYPSPGQIVYHDPRGDKPPEDFTFLQVDEPTVAGSIQIEPLLAEPVRQYWVLRISAAP